MRDLGELEAVVATDAGLHLVFEEAKARTGDDPGHDLSHAMRVALWTVRLGGASIDPREGVAAALLHDVVNVPKDSPERAFASQMCADAARPILVRAGFDAAAADRVCSAIRDHSYSRGAVPEDALGRSLQDADRLEALGAIGILRTATCGARMGARYFDPADPWAARRALDDKAFSIDHFFTKLLRLPETMCTPEGRREAEKRAALLRTFLRSLGDEIGVACPGT